MVAFLVVSHRNPGQVLRLVRALREGKDTQVRVRHDQRRSALAAAAVEEAGGRLLLDRHGVAWGDFAYAEMLIEALAQIAAEDDPDWVVIVSGQDYPLQPIAGLERHLADTPHQALLHDCWALDLDAEPHPPRDEFYRRYRFLHYPVPRPAANVLSRALGRHAYVRVMPPGLRDLIGIRPPRHPFGSSLRCHVSADWLTLHRRAIRSVLEFARTNPRALRHYRRTVIPSESLFATALAADRSIGIGQAPRAMRFRGRSPHPDVLGEQDVEELLASGHYFARKFDEGSDPGALDLLDQARIAARG